MHSSFVIRKSATIINFPTPGAGSESALERLMEGAVNTGDPHLNAINRMRISRIREILGSAQDVEG